MKIFIRAKPGAREEKVEKIDDNHFIVSVKEPPVKGQINEAIKKALSKFFKTKAYLVRIVSGRTSRQKIIEIINS